MWLACRDSQAKLDRFVALLGKWNARINLVGRGDAQAIWQRHIADCVQLAALIPSGTTRVVDLGSGGGLPGMVVAIATRAHVDLVERDQRKSAFLREAIGNVGVSATVHSRDFLAVQSLGVDVVTSRATAPLVSLLDAACRQGRKGAVMLFHKSAGQLNELDLAARRFTFQAQRIPSQSDARGEIWRVQGVHPREQ